MPGRGAPAVCTVRRGGALAARRGRWPPLRPAPLRRLRHQRLPRPGPRRLRRLTRIIPTLLRLRGRSGGPRHGRRPPPLLLPAPPRPPLACLYAWLSRWLLRAGLLDALARVALNKRQCFLCIVAGSLSHFFLDHLFEENGHSTMYTWILSTGWWKGRAPINPDAVFVVGLLCICLVGGFPYINRVKHGKSVTEKSNQSFFLILVIVTLYCMWCASQIYLRNPPQPAIGEEADLGVIIFLAIHLFLAHDLCVLSMNQKDYEALDEMPLR